MCCSLRVAVTEISTPFLQSKVVLAEGLDDFYDLLRIFALLGKKIPSGNRIAGVVNAGFESTVAIKELKKS